MCHNCHTSTTFQKFLKDEDPMLYRDFVLDSFVQSNTTNTTVDATDFVSKPVFKKQPTILTSDAIRINELNPNHPARKYLDDRKVPLDDLWFVEDFANFVSVTFPAHTKTLYKEPRIIIPFYNRDGQLLGIQGRSIDRHSKIKYITIKSEEENPKIFGWDKLNPNMPVYVVEGPIDSLFLNNSLATMDAALFNAPNIVGLDKQYIFVYDNEPRNKQIVSNMRKTIELGYKLCIWPDTIKEKDINEMVLAGTSSAAIQHIIDNNTYDGLMATMKLNQWSRV